MKRFDTPSTVARRLARYVPRRPHLVLDPAVGNGSLLRPLAKRFAKNGTRVFCVDIDETGLSELKRDKRLDSNCRSVLVNADFLEWAKTYKGERFDCVLMNPPFSGRKAFFRKVLVPPADGGEVRSERYVPLEAAFVLRSYELLSDGGRLLAVLPCSIVMAQSLQWFRDFLAATGAIRYVHELPARSFPGVESRMYLLVYDKGKKQGVVRLYNHDIQKSERLDVSVKRLGATSRLDFGYNSAIDKASSLIRVTNLNWEALENLAVVFRGDISSPIGDFAALHTTDFNGRFWQCTRHDGSSSSVRGNRVVDDRDILVKRVGRDCFRSFGPHFAKSGVQCSDCILVVRPKDRDCSERLLFGLLVLCEFPWMKYLLERGTGASYITERSLKNLFVPTDLYKMFFREFEFFSCALHVRSKLVVESCVKAVAEELERMGDG